MTHSRIRRFSVILLSLGIGLCGARSQVGDKSELDRSVPPDRWQMPDGKVRSPEESMALFDLPADFRVEVVAAEPLVQDPIAIQFDERGRLWVLEWPSYNWPLRDVIPGFEKLPPPKSQLAILEDTDGDGRMDRRTAFLDDIDWPRGLQIMKDGALVLRLPQLVWAHDENDDRRADKQDVLVSGLEIPVNPHGAQSNLFRAMDNWVYGSRFPQRLRLVSGNWVTQPAPSMRGQWGLSQDNYGRLLYASNGDHLRGDLVPGHYFARNPNYPVTAGLDVRYAADQVTTPQGSTPGVNRRNQLRDENGRLQVFTSNTAPAAYRGDQFPREYVGNVFLGEVAGRFLRRDVLTEADGQIIARNAYADREFLYSGDERFRPVFTTNGPDGTLYVADMGRGIIEGDIFVTSFLRNQAVKRQLQQPFNGRGRIYRIVHRGKPRANPPVLARDDGAGWVARLAHPNGFWRDTAQRVLVENGDRRVIPAIRKMALEHPDEFARLHAIWTLEGLGGIDADFVARATKDSSPKIRATAIRVAEPLLADAKLGEQILVLAHDSQEEVRRQLVFSLGETKGGVYEKALAEILERDAAKPIFVEAALSGLRDREYSFLQQCLKAPSWREENQGGAKLISALAHAFVNSGQNLGPMLAQIGDGKEPRQWVRLAILEGLTAAQKRGMTEIPGELRTLGSSQDDAVKSRALALAKAWSTPAASVASARSLTGPVLERGHTVFAICAACHGPEGKGQPALAPPLEGSAVLAAARRMNCCGVF